MKSFSISEIRSALRFGSQNNYVCFPEIRDQGKIDLIKKHQKLSKSFADTVSYANELKNAPLINLEFDNFIEFKTTGNRSHYEKKYFENQRQLQTIVMAEVLTDNGEYIDEIQRRLWQWCDIYTWELPAHVPLSPEEINARGYGADEEVALFSAETSFYLAEILSLVGNKIDSLLKYRLEKEIFRRVINPFMTRTYFWEEAAMNWSAVCAGSVGCACIYMIDDINKLAGIVSRIIAIFESFLLGFDKDGVTTEGISYWNYGFSFFVYFSELLKERTCGKINLLENDEYIKKIAAFPLYVQFPDSTVVNFSDAAYAKWDVDYGFICRLAKTTGVEGYKLADKFDIKRDHTSKWAVLSRGFLWGLDDYLCKDSNAKTGNFYFDESQWFIDRRKTKDNKFYAFVAKGGSNAEGHNHNDVGSFILHFDGENVLIDLGAPEYKKQYFRRDTRYTFLHASSSGHNLPVINGMEQKDGPERAEVLFANDDSETAKFALDFKGSYQDENLKKCERTFVWDYNEKTLEIMDEFEFEKMGNEIEEIFVSKGEIVKDNKNVKIILERSTTEVDFSEETEFVIKKEEFNNHSAEPDSANFLKLKFATKGNKITAKIKFTINQK